MKKVYLGIDIGSISTKGVIIDEDNIRLTNKGIDLANLVWEEFI